MHTPLPADAQLITAPFILYGVLQVRYDGRASSELQPDHYLLLHKADGSLAVHGSELTPPLNYQPAGSRLYRSTGQLICRSRKEQLVVELRQVQFECQLPDWAHHRIAIVRTERQLRDKLLGQLAHYLPGIAFRTVQAEAATEHGPVDILARDDQGRWHVIEVKRAQATVSAAVQLRKYVETFQPAAVSGYLAAPAIAPGALRYLQRHGFQYLQVLHD